MGEGHAEKNERKKQKRGIPHYAKGYKRAGNIP